MDRVLDQWCAEVGRDPAQIERSVLIDPSEMEILDAFIEAGARHIILELTPPYDFNVAERLVGWREAR